MNLEEATQPQGVYLGGVVVGLSIMGWYAIKWWRTDNQHDWKNLVYPFIPLWLFGMLIILCAGGLLGNIGNVTLWGSNKVGKIGLEQGVGGTDVSATRTTNLVLENGGHAVVVILTVVFVGYLVFSKESQRDNSGKDKGIILRIPIRTIVIIKRNWVLVMPVVSGISLGLAGGIAGFFADYLAPVVDTLGGLLTGVLG